MEEDENIPRYDSVPPDGGWGWLVLFGATLINLLVPGIIKSFGILFVEFLELFEFSETVASWIPALCYFLYCSLGPLASYLSTRYSYRTVTLIGGTFASLGMILSCFATSIVHLCITYGFLFGTGAGLSFPPGIFIVTSYFQKYRGFANGIAISGSSFGSMILPPILRYLLHNYGLNGAVLIMGAVTMNVWVGALFYHPVKWHMKRIPIRLEVKEEKSERRSSISSHNETEKIRPPKIIENGITENSNETSTKTNSYLFYDPTKKRVMVAFSPFTSEGSENNLKRNSMYGSVSSSLGRFASCESTLGRSYPEYASQITLKSITESINEFPCCQSCRKMVNDESNYCGCMGDLKKKDNESSIHCHKKTSQLATLLRNPVFITILISNASTAVGYTNFSIFLPAYAISLNYNKTLSSCLLSVIAFFDLIGRIGGSTISDILPLPKLCYFIVGLTLSGLSLAVLPLARTYNELCIACAVFGLSSGTYTGITVVTMVEMLGEDKLATSYTISLFVNGVLQLIGPPVCALLYENHRSFSVIISMLGVAVICGAAIWLFIPFVSSSKRKHSFRRSPVSSSRTTRKLASPTRKANRS